MPDTQLVATTITIFILLMILVSSPVALWQTRAISQKLDGIHDQLNSKMDKLLHAHGAAERAAGIESEREDQRQREEVERQRERDGRER